MTNRPDWMDKNSAWSDFFIDQIHFGLQTIDHWSDILMDNDQMEKNSALSDFVH